MPEQDDPSPLVLLARRAASLAELREYLRMASELTLKGGRSREVALQVREAAMRRAQELLLSGQR